MVVEGIVIGAQTGKKRLQAALETVQATSTPLLGATVVAILAFATIGVSQDSTGEYCRSLFQVILFSLGLSWVFAVTVTPLVGISFLKAGEQSEGEDPYAAAPYRIYRGFLETCLRRRGLTILVLLACFMLALYAFGYVDRASFPTRPVTNSMWTTGFRKGLTSATPPPTLPRSRSGFGVSTR